jgi:hypothetical protein
MPQHHALKIILMTYLTQLLSEVGHENNDQSMKLWHNLTLIDCTDTHNFSTRQMKSLLMSLLLLLCIQFKFAKC